jgi:transcriptional regulator with XRE-family HTH domain
MATKLQFLRKEKNMTLSEIANKVGVTAATISNWENGRLTDGEATNVDKTKMRKYFDILEISPNEGLHEVTRYKNKKGSGLNKNYLSDYLKSDDIVCRTFGQFCKDSNFTLEEGFKYISVVTGSSVIVIKNYLRDTEVSFKKYRTKTSKLYSNILGILNIDKALPGVYRPDKEPDLVIGAPEVKEECTPIDDPVCYMLAHEEKPSAPAVENHRENDIQPKLIKDIQWIKDAIFKHAGDSRTNYDYYAQVMDYLYARAIS